MRTIHEDKALNASVPPEDLGPTAKAAQAAVDALTGYTAGRPCPLCGRADAHCRPVSSVSYWCQQSGLLASDAAYVRTAPDPQAEQVRNDPQRNVAEVLLTSAQRAFDDADAAWRRAIGAEQHARRGAMRTEKMFDQSSPSGFRTTAAAKKLAMSVPKLEAAVAEHKRVRDDREIDLAAARRDYYCAADDALARAGLPRVGGNVPATDLRALVGGSW